MNKSYSPIAYWRTCVGVQKSYNNRFSGVCSPYTWNIQLPEVFTFSFILPGPFSSNGNNHQDYNASIDAQIFSRKCFLGCRNLRRKSDRSYTCGTAQCIVSRPTFKVGRLKPPRGDTFRRQWLRGSTLTSLPFSRVRVYNPSESFWSYRCS
jgi:hypothetical protein